MASIFMRIDGVTPKGAATVEKIGGKDGFFAIDSVSWGAVRGVGIDVGNSNNGDQGMVALGEVSVSRSCDGASAHLTSFLYAPGAEGKTIEIVMTKPNREGSGADPYLILTLKKARMASYNMSGSDGSLPAESFSLTYTQISKAYYIESDGGKIEKGPEVGFDAPTAKVTSTAK
ncbi:MULTISPECIES: type VI secretion system tube protein Hcp [unclassified Motilimonas]|uniref:Hcp family type VI secretion system effector n=1 Tax=unclassified Motilimonas TaxID=2643697 RepID=UPI001E3E2A3E|nr:MULTISPECIES: type VI secretion system tube protein Hcp [unclassified Motilimonas]MCE0557542.1 type VI secretion system tube protein Hcp [Motilimonas sp. E26]MDO6524574.1 type VI secretion system tube protein Hcp [Motilimonas sp. 1_MG-2023]